MYRGPRVCKSAELGGGGRTVKARSWGSSGFLGVWIAASPPPLGSCERPLEKRGPERAVRAVLPPLSLPPPPVQDSSETLLPPFGEVGARSLAIQTPKKPLDTPDLAFTLFLTLPPQAAQLTCKPEALCTWPGNPRPFRLPASCLPAGRSLAPGRFGRRGGRVAYSGVARKARVPSLPPSLYTPPPPPRIPEASLRARATSRGSDERASSERGREAGRDGPGPPPAGCLSSRAGGPRGVWRRLAPGWGGGAEEAGARSPPACGHSAASLARPPRQS